MTFRRLKAHQNRAALVGELDDRVAEIVVGLKNRGLRSPDLRSFVVARINPLRWIKGTELSSAEKALRSMLDRAAKFNLDKVNQQDLVEVYAGEPDA